MTRIKAVVVMEVEADDDPDPRVLADGLTLTLQDPGWKKVAFGAVGGPGDIFLDPDKVEVISWHEVE